MSQGIVPTTPTPTQNLPQQPQTGQNNPGGIVGGNQSGGRQTARVREGRGAIEIDPSQAVDFTEFTDTRNQGFVGATAVRITETGFVGAASQLSGPPLSADASFGGGVNSRVGGAGGGQFGNFSGSQFGGGQFGGSSFFGGGGQFGGNGFRSGSQNSFEVARGGLRSAIEPNFETTVFTGRQIARNFSSNYSKLPQTRKFNGQYQVSVNDKTATLTGWVRTQADADRLIAQLRLQPGVYAIENKLEVREK